LANRIHESFPGLIGGTVLNALADSSITSVGIFAIASDMGQLVRVCLPVHGVGEVLPMRRLSHRGPPIVTHAPSRSLDAWVLGAHSSYTSDVSGVRVVTWSLRGTTMVDPFALASVLLVAVLHRR
jgi:hypothetical protein